MDCRVRALASLGQDGRWLNLGHAFFGQFFLQCWMTAADSQGCGNIYLG
jgi:hypothetical protein